MTSHQEARELAAHAISLALGVGLPAEHAIRHLAGVGTLETQYGAGWKGAGVGSNNMGAIQAYGSWSGERFSYTDTHPNPDGTSTPYTIAFRAYPTPLDGWVDLARIMYSGSRRDVLLVASRGDTYSVSELMRRTGYYEGFGPTQHDRIRNHMLALRRAIVKADSAAGLSVPYLPLEGVPVGVPATVRFGSKGESVKTLQRELKLAADGIFGRITERTLAEYQVDHRLVPDGVCGPATWQALLTDDYAPDAI